jgi:hypothetical protein
MRKILNELQNLLEESRGDMEEFGLAILRVFEKRPSEEELKNLKVFKEEYFKVVKAIAIAYDIEEDLDF